MDSTVNVDVTEDKPPEVLTDDEGGENSQGSYKFVRLYHGFDNLDESDKEVLRDEMHFSQELDISPILPRKKLSGGFRLTPRLDDLKPASGEPLEEKDESDVLNLTTPQHCLSQNTGVDCPERPFKDRRSSNLLAAEKSCRHLSYKDVNLSASINIDRTSQGNDEGFHHCPASSYSSREGSALSKKSKLTVSCSKEEYTAIREEKEVLDLSSNLTPEKQTTPDLSPSTSNSVCSRSSCSISSCSSALTLPSPNTSDIKETSQTIESSEGEIEDLSIREVVADPPELETKEKICLKQQNHTDVFKGPPSPALKSATSIGNVNNIGNTMASSTDSGHSNWTVMSGVSPLPSSDPTHLRHKNHFHFHRHHHHHYHHPPHNHHHHYHHPPHSHHHHCHHRRSIKAKNRHIVNNQNLGYSRVTLTSTPKHNRVVKERLDVSDIEIPPGNDSQLLIPEPSRFVISADIPTSNEWIVSEKDTGSIGSPCIKRVNLPSALFRESTCSENSSFSQELGPPKKKRHCSEKTDTAVDVNEGIPLSKEDGESIKYYNPSFDGLIKDAGRTPFVRKLDEEEVRSLYSMPVNVMDDFFESGPCMHHSLDEGH